MKGHPFNRVRPKQHLSLPSWNRGAPLWSMLPCLFLYVFLLLTPRIFILCLFSTSFSFAKYQWDWQHDMFHNMGNWKNNFFLRFSFFFLQWIKHCRKLFSLPAVHLVTQWKGLEKVIYVILFPEVWKENTSLVRHFPPTDIPDLQASGCEVMCFVFTSDFWRIIAQRRIVGIKPHQFSVYKLPSYIHFFMLSVS